MPYYNIAFYSVIVLLFLLNVVVILLMDRQKILSIPLQKGLILIITFALFLITGFRGRDVGADTSNYLRLIEQNLTGQYESEYFSSLLFYLSRELHQPYLFLVVCAAIFTRNLTFVIIRTNRKVNLLLLFFVFWTFFFTRSMATNVIRQGVAVSFLLLALSYFEEGKKGRALWNSIWAVGFHTTALLPVFGFLLASVISPLSLFVVAYFGTLIWAASGHGIVDLMKLLGLNSLNERSDVYFVVSFEEYNVGFKPQFAVFNTFFLGVFLLAYREMTANREVYLRKLKLYIFNSCIFFLMFQLPFSDRWGLFSWMLIPLLMIPYLVNEGRWKLMYASGVILFQAMIFVFFELTQK